MTKKNDGPSPEEKLCADLIGLLEAGVNPWQRPWVGDCEHRNLVSGHHYTGGNPLLLQIGALSRGHDLPLWIGAGQAKAHGWHPAKGSRCARIAQPMPVTVADGGLDADDVQGAAAKPSARTFARYRLVPVFNVADLAATDAAAASDLARRIDVAMGEIESRPEAERLTLAEDVLGAWPVPVALGGGAAAYMPSADKISLPQPRAFNSREAFAATWAHEAIHSTGHPSRLARKFGRFGSADYAREELVAEMGSAILCRRLGIGSELEGHAAYLQSWIEILREEPKALLRALGSARKAADLISPEAEASDT